MIAQYCLTLVQYLQETCCVACNEYSSDNNQALTNFINCRRTFEGLCIDDTVPSKSSWNKIKYFLAISKNVLILNALYKQYGSKIRPNETLGLIFDPYCLIPSISLCWKLVVLRGITWIMWLCKFCKFYNLDIWHNVRPRCPVRNIA